MDLTELSLRAIGAFYVFAGYVATRAALASSLIDHALAAIAAEKPTAAERMQSLWLLCASLVILAGGVLLTLLVDLAAWAFGASAVSQALYLYVVAPRWFDVAEPPDARGRRQSTNAFVVYAAVTALIVWAAAADQLDPWWEVPWPLFAGAMASVAAYAVYTLWMFTRPLRSAGTHSDA
jgi:hypothetical protein